MGYPVAHFVTNFIDECMIICLVRSLTDRCPDLVVNVIMTDGDEALGNAVKKLFGFDTCFIKCCEVSCSDLCCHMYCCFCPDSHSLCKQIYKVHSLKVRLVSNICFNPCSPQSDNLSMATSLPRNGEDHKKDSFIYKYFL